MPARGIHQLPKLHDGMFNKFSKSAQTSATHIEVIMGCQRPGSLLYGQWAFIFLHSMFADSFLMILIYNSRNLKSSIVHAMHPNSEQCI